ncbi:putative phenazine biosynthesis PhzC/PhzF protein [Crocosphaera subtropica ATCC 51142]|uniref:Phenazine biosynthesis PhzC/PhzF protein n=1 Tax=Crocosphaera subtropica (strain ATCC 51142 / BH68) TaxID=43989 RepID=B1WXS1_CROS5|nr:PhzF family phenazine biosynthesis protein [Crocosphaera subtropica]ACB50908.1 putative phenazine biosynthesis PhzC/PhzF protein [Crocosphaera subtropica ATCC 51142]
MAYSFYTVDVFTNTMFGGNQLAVFPNAEGLSTEIMQKIAAEFNFSETVFIFHSTVQNATKKLRIFTPSQELPFAGHPTLGAAYILGLTDDSIDKNDDYKIIFEEGVGLVLITIKFKNQQPIYTELTSPQLPEFSDETPSIEELGSILSLKPEDFRNDNYIPQAVSCGLPFLFVPLHSRDALKRIKLNSDRWQQLLGNAWASSLYVFCFDPENEGSNIRARMFAPGLGVTEDPATGSAATAFGGYLGIRETEKNGQFNWRIEQGFEMRRPSFLEVTIEKIEEKINKICVGGASVLVTQGTMHIS